MIAKELPEEIRDEILLKVPIKDLVRFRCVCKNWLLLLSTDSYFFSTRNTSNTSFLVLPLTQSFLLYYATIDEDQEPVKYELPFSEEHTIYHPTCVCNGMICFTSSAFEFKSPVHVWNPLTTDYITIPCPDISYQYYYDAFVSFGFVFHQDANEYKLIRLIHNNRISATGFRSHVSIYVLGTDSWRSLEDDVIPYLTCCSNLFAPHINGALHWVAVKLSVPLIVLAFDTRDEVFQEIALLNDFIYKSYMGLHVSEFGGLLCVNYVLKDLDIWLMKEYGVVESWTMQFRVRRTEVPAGFIGIILLGLASNGHILMKTGLHKVILYNPETNFIVDHKEFNIETHYVLPFKTSIVSPKSYQWSRFSDCRTKSDRKCEKNKFQITINSLFKSFCSCTHTP